MKNQKRKIRKRKWKTKNEKQKTTKSEKKDLEIISVIECVNDWYYQMIGWRSVWAKKRVKHLVFWAKCFRFQIKCSRFARNIRDFERNVWDFEPDGWCFDLTVLDFESNFSDF